MAKPDERSVDEIRAERESVNAQIETLKVRARDLSVLIREKEGPIPDRTGRAKTNLSVRRAS